MMDNNEVITHVTGEASMGEVHRMLSTALSNMDAELVAQHVVAKLMQVGEASKIIKRA